VRLMFDKFFGHKSTVATLRQMIAERRIPQTLLLAGPEGVGKATLARRFAAGLLGEAEKIEADDLSLPHNTNLLSDREKWPADKRSEDPLHFATHADFLTFPPDGPLRQISIQQMRLLKERAQFKPLRGEYRVFLIDHLDRANEQAANSLLKTLEEPPDHLILVATAENAYDLLPTIRSRAVMFNMNPLSAADMQSFARGRGLSEVERRIALSDGSPGIAMQLDLEAYDKRRSSMLRLLEVASGNRPFAEWTKTAESLGASRTEKLESYLRVLYILLEDLLILQHHGDGIRNIDLRTSLEPIARSVAFDWIRRAVVRVDELSFFLRRNIQKSVALDALVVSLRDN
jgi:DNA polymerase-3 subunit delta'